MSFPIVSYKILRKFLSGMSMDEVAKDYGVHVDLVNETVRWGFTKEGNQLVRKIIKDFEKVGRANHE